MCIIHDRILFCDIIASDQSFFTMRIIALFTISCLFFSSCKIVRSLRDAQKMTRAEITSPSATEQRIPFRLVGNKVVLSVTVKGEKSAKTDFILDTGAPT